MNRRVLWSLVLMIAVANCKTIPAPSPSLAGQWAPIGAELSGRKFPVASFDAATLRLTTDTYDFAGDKGTFAILPGNSGGKMDIHGLVGPNAGRTIPAIYALDGDYLTITYQLGPGDRPSAFASPKGSQVLLIHYKRVR